jgi:hypothetical protein
MSINYRDWAKQFYMSTKNYQDTAAITQSKEIWNHVLSKYPRLSEFWTGTHDLRELTSIERSFIEYIIQSELQKPYRNPYYPEMEYTWPNWEFPWPECDDFIEDCDPTKPEILIFDAESPSCFCPGGVTDFEITGTHPIYFLTITHTDCPAWGTGVAIHGGWGTNRLYGQLRACGSEKGFITIEASMNAASGRYGDSNVNIFECPENECCGDESTPLLCSGSNPATVAPSGNATLAWTGGSAKGPWHIAISGSGFWLDALHTITEITRTVKTVNIYCDGSSCGAGQITVTDQADGCEELSPLLCNIRNTNGTWNNYAGCGEVGTCCNEAVWVGALLKSDNITCVQWDAFDSYSSCSTGGGGCGCTDPSSSCPGVTNCLMPPEGFTAAICSPLGLSFYGEPDNCGASGVLACWADCVPPQAGKANTTRCYVHKTGYPNYNLWECP